MTWNLEKNHQLNYSTKLKKSGNKMYLIDTNIFLEILLDQERSAEWQELFDDLQDREVIFYVSSFTVHSIEVILERHDPKICFYLNLTKKLSFV